MYIDMSVPYMYYNSYSAELVPIFPYLFKGYFLDRYIIRGIRAEILFAFEINRPFLSNSAEYEIE